jgi:E3 ubiquitin-protein ligase TRIP12
MSSFLGSIISAKDNPTFVLHALQLVELLATKLAIIFLTSFLREGVVYEIEALAEEDLNIKAASEEDTSPTDSPVKVDTVLPITPKATSSSSAAQQITPVTELSSGGFIATYLASGVSASTKHVVSDPNDANILRARVIGAKRVFAVDGSQQNEAALVLSELAALVKRLCVAEATEAELRDTLRVIAAHFSNVDQALSSFELLKSGLVDGLLEYVDIDGAVSSSERRAILYDIFSDTTLASPSPLVMLVKRLHESLGRLENFQVETAFGGMNGVGSSTTSLARSMRIRLQAEDGDDVPKQVSQLSVTIQAIAPVQALHDYLRPRIADPMYLSGNAALQNMFAAYAASRGGGGSAARLLAALTGASGASGSLGGLGGSGAAARLGTSAGAATGSSSTAPEAPATDKKEVKSQRRRSARLNRAGDQGEEEGAPEASSSTAPLSVSAPEPSALSRLSLGMDFDDDYSDEDYDAEVFEEDMDEELLPPTEKVVNMSMAADGSRVEAKTPDGTRIATPNQASTSKTAATATPTRTGSYAGALKSAPTDWHLEFSINGHVLALEDTIYGAVHKMSNRDSAPVNVFNLPVTFKFRKVEGPPPPPKDAPMDAPSPASTSSVLPPGLEPSSEVSKILRLLRVVHNLCVEAHDTACRPDAPYEKLFVNNKLTAKLTRQLEETMILASNCLPDWAVELSQHFSFLFPFETRYNFLRSTSFGYARLISHWQASQPRNNSNGRRDDNLAHLGRLVRQKVRISRAQLLESCAKVLEVYGTSNGVLEVEYFDEIGTGLGPTLEFYSLASKEFARRSLKLWRDEDDSKPGAYVFHSHGLFPAPVLPNEPSIETAGSRLAYFKTLGLFVGRALLDSRIIDLHINKVFLKLLLSKPVKKSISTLKLIDASVARSLERLQSYLQARKEIESLVSLPASSRRAKLAALTINGAKLQDLSLDFTLPGYDIELKPGGRMIDVDDSNLEEYLELVVDKTLGSGVQPMVKAFQEGFSMIFPIQHMQIFSPDEFGLLCGNVDEDWSRETLEQSIKADHGYNSDSRTVKNLIDVMASYTLEERRQFLQFITGAPKLPIGGFRSGLNPPFTVVRKPHEPPIKADQMLPSVMTCAQYLKLPDYSSIEVLHAQLLRATLDGSGSFHLS